MGASNHRCAGSDTAHAAKGNGTYGAIHESKTKFVSCTDTSIGVFVIKLFSMTYEILVQKVPFRCIFADGVLGSVTLDRAMYFSFIKLNLVVFPVWKVSAESHSLSCCAPAFS